MAERFNPPPDWPPVPRGWKPPRTWRPDPAWPSPPDGWSLWLDDDANAGKPAAAQPQRAVRALATVSALAIFTALLLVACSTRPTATPDWYLRGTRFVLDAQHSRELGPIGPAAAWCARALNSGRAEASGLAPPASSGRPAHLWLLGCVAGYRHATLAVNPASTGPGVRDSSSQESSSRGNGREMPKNSKSHAPGSGSPNSGPVSGSPNSGSSAGAPSSVNNVSNQSSTGASQTNGGQSNTPISISNG
jgi:hypothetical protein